MRTRRHMAVAVLTLAAGSTGAATFKTVLLTPADDPRLQRSRLEKGFIGHAGGPAVQALQVSLAEARFELGAAGVAIELQAVEVADAASARAAAAKAEKDGAAAIVADLPAAWLLAAADATRAPVLNIGDAADHLREVDCRRNLFHVLPSERMRADALAQTLVARKWTQVLLLTGAAPADAARSAAAHAAIRRYGLKLAGTRPFKASADPRERALANPVLLTEGTHDVIWVVDAEGEFAAALPYRTATPRPVVGDGGLVAVAWSRHFDRFGAPQVTRRIARAVQRPATSHDWVSWMSGKALVAAAVAAPKGPAAAFQQALAKAEIDGSKGVSMSFRPWDGQLRQPLLLDHGQGVAAMAPTDGVLHPRSNLDALGADQPEKLCKARS